MTHQTQGFGRERGGVLLEISILGSNCWVQVSSSSKNLPSDLIAASLLIVVESGFEAKYSVQGLHSVAQLLRPDPSAQYLTGDCRMSASEKGKSRVQAVANIEQQFYSLCTQTVGVKYSI